MNQQHPFPRLDAWMSNTAPTHPLHEVIAQDSETNDAESFERGILVAFDEVIETLEAVEPQRLNTERAEFRRAATDDDLMIVRAELVAAAKLARAGVPFDFGQRVGKPEPDLILRDANLAIEVKARRLDGYQDLRDELEAALTDTGAPVGVHVLCEEHPLVIKPDVRAELIADILQRVKDKRWEPMTKVLEQPWAAKKKLALSVRIFEMTPAPSKPLVVTSSGGPELSGHFMDAEREVLAVLNDPQKVRQAESMPTILMVDAARTGLSWNRSQRSWALRLADQIPDTTPFVGVGVMIQDLSSSDVAMSIGVRPNLQHKDADAVSDLAKALGLNGI